MDRYRRNRYRRRRTVSAANQPVGASSHPLQGSDPVQRSMEFANFGFYGTAMAMLSVLQDHPVWGDSARAGMDKLRAVNHPRNRH
ncbi:hypothetical protein GF324_01670 [bacterium]|nr:hypothetical protein [bacterium]